jgi:hypothetical protein
MSCCCTQDRDDDEEVDELLRVSSSYAGDMVPAIQAMAGLKMARLTLDWSRRTVA